MCGRVVINYTKGELAAIADSIEGLVGFEALEPVKNYNIPPGTNLPLFLSDIEHNYVSVAHWGLVPSWAKDRSFQFKTFNARSESIFEKPSFRGVIKGHAPTKGSKVR